MLVRTADWGSITWNFTVRFAVLLSGLAIGSVPSLFMCVWCVWDFFHGICIVVKM